MTGLIRLVTPLLIFSVFGFSTAQNYCNIQSCKDYQKGVHTMCAYTSPHPSNACGNLRSAQITRQERDIIVKKHNAFRQKVASGQETRGMYQGGQPAAAYMPDLTWDDQLATIAQRWANQCNYAHDSCRDISKYQVGQNIAKGMATGNQIPYLTVENMVQGWYDEVAVFDSSFVDSMGSTSNSRGEDIGHYTQVVWAKTTKIGCGKVSYVEGSATYLMLVCNYGPSGNFPGQPIYERA